MNSLCGFWVNSVRQWPQINYLSTSKLDIGIATFEFVLDPILSMMELWIGISISKVIEFHQTKSSSYSIGPSTIQPIGFIRLYIGIFRESFNSSLIEYPRKRDILLAKEGKRKVFGKFNNLLFSWKSNMPFALWRHRTHHLNKPRTITVIDNQHWIWQRFEF